MSRVVIGIDYGSDGGGFAIVVGIKRDNGVMEIVNAYSTDEYFDNVPELRSALCLKPSKENLSDKLRNSD